LIGKVGLSKEYLMSLTPAETSAIVDGYIYNRDIEAANFRALFWLTFNQFSKHQRRAEELWPLSIDSDKEVMTMEEMYERNKRVIESMGFN
jgi:hypothetical protein